MNHVLGEVEVGNVSTTSTHLSAEVLTHLRQMAYRLLASLYLYPDSERINNLSSAAGELLAGDLWEGWSYSASFEPLLELLSRLTEGEIKPIVDEYNRLFLVKPQAPPYESFYMDPEGQFRGWMAAKLLGKYGETGLALSPSLNEMPDHIAVELEFMSFLCGEEAEAKETGDEEKDIQIRERQRAFLSQHLGRWFPIFTRRLKVVEPGRLYRLTIDATGAFLRQELEILGLIPHKER